MLYDKKRAPLCPYHYQYCDSTVLCLFSFLSTVLFFPYYSRTRQLSHFKYEFQFVAQSRAYLRTVLDCFLSDWDMFSAWSKLCYSHFANFHCSLLSLRIGRKHSYETNMVHWCKWCWKLHFVLLFVIFCWTRIWMQWNLEYQQHN